MSIRTWALIGVLVGCDACGFGDKTFLAPRSQAVDAVRELVGWQQQIHQYGIDQNYQTFSIMPYYSHLFAGDKVARFLTGSNTLTFSGSRVADRADTDILADYFGVPSDYKSTVCLDPQIVNFSIDLNWYLGLNCLLPGLYFRMHAPITNTKWNLQATECIASLGVNGFPAGYMSADAIDRKNLAPSIKDYWQGSFVFGDMSRPLQYGKVFGRQQDLRLSELQMVLGYNIFLCDRYHLGIGLRTALPTGTRPDAEFLFEPINGNCKHWELGAALTGHIQLWESSDYLDRVALYVDANITHLLSSTQKRSFDFKSAGNGSRYMLLSQICPPAQPVNLNLGAAAPGGTPASKQYQRYLIPAINATTFDVSIAIPVQLDVVAKLSYQRCAYEFDLGYNFWYRSAEQLRRCQRFTPDMYAFKGDAQLYGFDPVTNNAPIALSVSQSGATIRKGQGAGNTDFTNANADNPVTAYTGANQLNQLNAAFLGINPQPVLTSQNPVLLNDADLNECSGIMPKGYTHKIFAHVNRQWDECDDCVPYMGVGGSAEWADTNANTNSGASLWAIWFKCGITY